jgi:L-lactate dehydrogenase complex protein LldG
MSETNSVVNQNGVLDDVRRALGRSKSVPPVPLPPFIEPSIKTAARDLARFTEEATAVRAQVHYLSGKLQSVVNNGVESAIRLNDQVELVEGIVEQIAEICVAYKGLEIALSGAQVFAEMNLTSKLEAQGFSTFVCDETDHEQKVARLAGCGVGLTAASYAIAETGTIVLDSDEQNALLVSLLPPVHIALVRSSQIAASVDEVISKIGKERIGPLGGTRSVTLITGPSRTSDVELVLSIGVHGPKELHVIIFS